MKLLGIEEGVSVTPSGPGGQPCAALYKGDLRNDSFIAANGLHRPLNLATCLLYIYQGASQEAKRYAEAEKQGIPRPRISELQLQARSCLSLAGVVSALVLIETIRQGELNFTPYFCVIVMALLPFWALFAALNKASEEKRISEEKRRGKNGQEG